MNKGMQIGLIGGAVVFAVTQYWPYLSGKKSTPAPAVAEQPTPQTQVPAAQPAAENKLPIKNSLKDYQRMLALARRKDWGPNPFKGNTTEEEMEEEETVSEVEVQIPLHIASILITEHQKLAIINQRLVKVGDIIQDKIIVQINKDSVVLDDNGEQLELRLVNDKLPMKIYSVKAEELNK